MSELHVLDGKVMGGVPLNNTARAGTTITMSTTPYTAPTDGYVWIYMANQGNLYSVSVTSSDDQILAVLRGQASIGYEYHSIFVKKGMKVVCNAEQSLTGGDTVWFKSLLD